MSFDALDAKEQIRQAVDIVDVAGGYFQLRREGRHFKALCPWHDDARPSLQINPERQSYRCWVCDIGGDVFSLVMRLEGITFPEAMAQLAERAGIVLSQTRGSAEKVRKKRGLYEVLAWTAEQYHRCLLHAPEALVAREYLGDRGISPECWKQFVLGYAPLSWDWIQQRARRDGISTEQLEEAGVIGLGRQGNRHYDRFRGRVLFTIRDVQGRPVGFGGRVMPGPDADRAAKYINSPETPLFSKHKLLYGLDRARDAISRSRTALVVEGYTDCLMGHQSGIQNMVAVLGTALGETHIRTLRPYTDKIILVLDGDDAGRRRANEVLPLFLAQQVDLRILTLPDDLDPCDYLLKFGAEAFHAAAERAEDALAHKFREIRDNLGGGVHQVHQALEDVLKTMAANPAPSGESQTREGGILATLASFPRVPEETLRKRLSELRHGSRGRSKPTAGHEPQRGSHAEGHASGAPAQAAVPGEPWETQLLELTLLHPELFEQFRLAVRSDQFRSAVLRGIFVAAASLCEEGRVPSLANLLMVTEEARLQSRLVALDESAQEKHGQRSQEELTEIAQQLIHHLSWQELERDTRQEAARLQDRNLDAQHAEQILKQILEQERSRHGISLPTEG